jgi:hypothetical protein
VFCFAACLSRTSVSTTAAIRRDLKMGRGYGKLFMTADGMLIARIWQRLAFSDRVDVIMEEYMTLEQNGEVIVDKMACLHVSRQ